MSKAKLQVYVDEALFRRLRIRAAEVGEPMSALVERALRKELGAMEDRETFARHLGYASWDDLLAASEEVAIEGDISWYVTRLPDGRWAAWDDAEIAIDRVSIHPTREDAVAYLWECWQDSHGDEGESETLRWKEGWPLGAVAQRVWDARCDLLDRDGAPLDGAAIQSIGEKRIAEVRFYADPESLIEEGEVHPRWRGTNRNWRSAAPAWNESGARVWGDVRVGDEWFWIVGEEDPRP